MDTTRTGYCACNPCTCDPCNCASPTADEGRCACGPACSCGADCACAGGTR